MLPNNNFVIKPMVVDDIDQIMEIENESFPTPWHKKIFEMELKKPRTLQLVCKKDSKVIGYLVSWMLYDEIHILNVAVRPDFRRNGIAKQLLDYTIKQFVNKGAITVILEVRTSNKAALNLYEKLGFKTIRARKNYYIDTGEDALVMMLDISSNYNL